MDDLEGLTTPDLGNEEIDNEIPEEGELPQEPSKQKAAFARLRKERADWKKKADELEQKMKVGTGQSQPNIPPPTEIPDTIRRKKAYMQSLQQRTVSEMQGMNFSSQEEQSAAYVSTMVALASRDAVSVDRYNQAVKEAPRVVSSVLKEFPNLNDVDKAEVQKRIEVLPVELRTDDSAIRKEVYSYVGENMERFRSQEPPEKGKEIPLAPGGKRPLGGSVGASVASEGKTGSPGIKVQPAPQGGKPRIPALKAEDIAAMKKAGLSPSNAEEVKLHLDGMKKKSKYLQ